MANPALIRDEVKMLVSDVETETTHRSLADELDQLASQSSGGDDVPESNSERRMYELLLIHALRACGGNYGFVLSPAGRGAYAEQFVKLVAAVEKDSKGKLQPCFDTLMNRRPDPMIQSVMRLRRGVCGKPTDIGLPMCLPGSHPSIRYFLMVPIESGVSHTSVLFVANPARTDLGNESSDLSQELQAMSKVLSDRQRLLSNLPDGTLTNVNEDNNARHYVQLMSASINAVVIVDSKGSITAFNPAAENLFGRESIHALGTGFDRYLPQDFLMPILKYAENFDVDTKLKEVVPVNRRSVTAVCESGNLAHLVCSAYFSRLGSNVYTTFVFDYETEAPALSDNGSGHQQFQALTNVAPVGILQLGADWNCEYANEMWCRLSGLSMDETLEEGWVDSIHSEDVVDTLVDLREALSKNQIFKRNLRLQTPTGKISWVILSATVTINEMGHFTGCLIVLLDVTETHLATEELRFNATHDVLTGLCNRSAFLDYLQERLNTNALRQLTALFYLDLDDFKAINDTMGHDCGDELLRKVALRLKSSVTQQDLCSRLGGDEFTIIVTSVVDQEEICELAEKIVRNLNETFEVYENQINLSVSIGISIGSENASSSDAFIKQADLALYKAKSSSRSRWIVYTKEFQHEDIKRSILHSRIRRATERQEFSLAYQPQFTIHDKTIVSFEALLRWKPNDVPTPEIQTLVSVLEESGLINDVGQWVIETACRQFMQWDLLNLVSDTCTISINVSPAQLGLANFVPRLKLILQRCGMEPERLNLEITESALIEKNSSCINVINQIKDMGVKLSLDDFGTGYASLSYLTRLPIDFLKIDKSFVTAMNTDESSRTIVMSVLALAGTLNISVVAEGIEDQIILEQLREANCEIGQGFLFSRPLEAEKLEKVLIKNAAKLEKPIELV
ncbi:MAG: EAL domain-containing protein [Granulosicoccus sp.]|nr:EAL domain-containing protein [Granulosicoccus sp.]